LRRHRWRFSLRRAALPADATAPDFGYANQFVLPAESLQVIQIGEYDLGPNLCDYRSAPTERWSIEGRKILANLDAPLKVRFVERVEDTGLFDSCFTEALASRLAYECCYRITQSSEREDRGLRDYRMSLREAARANVIERAPGEPTDDTWMMARLG
jgi:hypothetical protein